MSAIDLVLDPAHDQNVESVRSRGRDLMRDEVTVEGMVAVFDAAIRRHIPPCDPGLSERTTR